MHIKAEGMTQVDIFHVTVENSVNIFALFCPLLQRSLHNKYKQTPKEHNNNNLNLKLSSVTYIIDERYQIIDLGSQFLGYMLDQTVKLG